MAMFLPPPGQPRGSQHARQPIVPPPAPAPSTTPVYTPRKRRPMRDKATMAAMASAKLREISQGEVAAYALIETEMGGRQALVAALAAAALDTQTERVLGMIGDPRNDHLNLATICVVEKVSLTKLMGLIKTAKLARAQLLAIDRIAEKAPDVAAAVMADAVSGLRTCGLCLGGGKLMQPTVEDPEATVPCTECRGAGSIQYIADHDVQKTALKIAGLLDEGRGTKVTTIVAQQQINGGGTDPGTYDSLISSLDSLIYGVGRDRLTAMHAPVDSGGSAADQTEPAEGEIVE